MAPLSEFLDHLGRAVPELAHSSEPQPDWLAFRRECEARERAGREEFGDDWLYRDNAAAGMEEAADGANYAHFEAERIRANGGDYDEALQLATIAADHFYRAHEALQALRSHVS